LMGITSSPSGTLVLVPNNIQPFIEGFFPNTPWMGEFPEEN